MSINYTTYVSQISNLMVIVSTDANFTTMLPGMIDYAEQRCYRDLDLLYTQVTDTSGAMSSGVRTLNVSTAAGTFITVDNVNVFTPSSATSSNATRVQLTPVSREFIDLCYPSASALTNTPEFWAMASNTQVIFGPTPDKPYPVEVIGIQRPAVLSSANSSTILTQYVPDLFIAASMVFASGYMRDFGAQADTQGMGVSWEQQYKTLMQTAAVEQIRAKHMSEAWTSDSPNPVATPKRV